MQNQHDMNVLFEQIYLCLIICVIIGVGTWLAYRTFSGWRNR